MLQDFNTNSTNSNMELAQSCYRTLTQTQLIVTLELAQPCYRTLTQTQLIVTQELAQPCYRTLTQTQLIATTFLFFEIQYKTDLEI